MAGFRYFLILICCISLSFSRKLPSYIKQCKMDDPQLNKCILTAIEVIRPHFNEGIPDMKLPSANPFHLDKINLNTGSFVLELLDVSIIGLINVQIDDLNIDLDKNLVTVKASVPQIELRSSYSLNGNLLAIAIQGSGHQEAVFFNLHYSMRMQGQRETRNGKMYVTFDKIENQVDVNQVDAKFRFDDLFKGNPDLTARTNEVLNENSKALLNDIKKLVEETIGSVILSLFKSVFDTFSLDELFV